MLQEGGDCIPLGSFNQLYCCTAVLLYCHCRRYKTLRTRHMCILKARRGRLWREARVGPPPHAAWLLVMSWMVSFRHWIWG